MKKENKLRIIVLTCGTLFCAAAVDPEDMGIGFALHARKLLIINNIDLFNLGSIEIDQAFALKSLPLRLR